MTWPAMDIFARILVARVVNSLPEGILIALGAWLLLRLLGRQNSGTRFAVWMVALVGVAVLPLLSAVGAKEHFASLHSAFIIPSFWALAVLALWIPVAVTALVRLAVGLWQVRQIRRSCKEICVADLDPALRQVIEQAKTPVRLLVSEKARVPAALGFRVPAVVLPAWTLCELTSTELQPILIHELEHLRRHDGWTNLFQKFIRAILFFHPAVWWIDTRLSLEREMACDDAVLAATGNPRAYAGCLIDLLERSCARRGWTMTQAAVTRAREASQRIARILHSGDPATTGIARSAPGLVAVFAMVCSGVMLCAPGLLVFAPATQASVARVQTLPAMSDSMVPHAAMVPAAYHPAQRSNLVHSASLTHTVLSHRHATRFAAQRKTRSSAVPFALASLNAPADVNQPLAASMFLVVDMSAIESGDIASVLPAGVAHQFQNTVRPVTQIETLQFVEASSTGFRIQVLRIRFTMPVLMVTNPESTEQRVL